MQFLFVVVALVAIVANFMLNSSDNSTSTPSVATNTTIETSSKNASYSAVEPSAGFSIDTYITSAPNEGQVITDTNKVVFKFWGGTDQAIKSDISYETKIVGLDSKWQSNNSGQRTVEFPGGTKEYTFMVRTKVDGYYDTTPASVTFKIVTSDYFGKLKISSVSASSISFSEKLSEGESLDISGWKIKGKGGEFIIPKGIKLYPGYTTNDLSDILLEDGQSLYIQSASSPFQTNNAFVPNKCFGYLNNTGFSYSKICPKITREEVCNYSEACQNAILKMNNCTRPDSSTISSLTYDYDCQTYINNYANLNLSYGGCVSNFTKDSDFYKKAWYIYAGFSATCKSSCGNDTIYLYDTNGLLVDRKEYKL